MRGIKRITAVCMALMLLLALIPAQETKAATPKMNYSERTVYVGGSTVRTGNYAKGSYTLKVKDKPSKYSCTWENDNEDVVTVIKKSGGKAEVKALKVGTATVTANVVDKKTKETYTLTCKITTKKNCGALLIEGEPDEAMEIDDTLSLVASMYDTAGKKMEPGAVTDIVKWASDNKKVATVDENGKVTAIGPGTAQITCYTVDAATGKYSKLAKATAKKTVTVEVDEPDIIGIASIRQKSLNRLELTFGKDYSDVLSAGKISVTGADGIILPVEKLEFAQDKMTATVTVKDTFIEGMTYIVAMSDTDATVGISESFAATKGVPVKLEIVLPTEGKQVVAQNQTELQFRIFNAQDVDITPVDKNSIDYLNYKAITKFEALNTGSWYVNNGYIYIQNANSQVSVKATMSGAVAINGTVHQIDLTATDVITSVNEASTVVFDVTKDLILTNSVEAGEKLVFDGAQLSMPAKETKTGYRLIARVKNYAGEYIYSDGAAAGKITFETPKSAKSCYVASNGDASSLDAAGSDPVYIKFNGQVIGTATINVIEARKASSMIVKVDGTQGNLAFYSDVIGVGDLRIDVEVYDQYGAVLPIKGTGAASLATNLGAEITISSGCPSFSLHAREDGTGYIDFTCAGFGSLTGKTYLYKITYMDPVYGTFSQTFTLVVQTPIAQAPSAYTVAAEGDTDMTLSAVMNDFPYVKVVLYEWKNNLKYGTVTPVYSSEHAAPVEGFFYELRREGSNELISISGCTETDRIYTVYPDYTGKLSMLAPGDYSLSVYQKKSGGVIPISGTNFTLTGQPGSYSVKNISEITSQTITADTEKDLAQLRSIFAECFSLKKDGNDISSLNIDFPKAPKVLDKGIIYFDTASVTETVRIAGKIYTIVYTLNIDKMIYDKTYDQR
ncbi:MAG: Ig-like domain-containing protein [Lachnospiraceae bacterium]|nr:Ig-like domain-containing protein [Lachnospiraceae bacterium]